MHRRTPLLDPCIAKQEPRLLRRSPIRAYCTLWIAVLAVIAPLSSTAGQAGATRTGVQVQTELSAVRPSTLANLIEDLAGRTVRVRNARVVGVLNPRAFLIESATRFPMMLSTRDRIIVLVGGGALRVTPETIVGSNVVITGVARTLLGIQVTREVAWPVELTRAALERLEVRAAVLASRVKTAEGVDLTDQGEGP